MGIVALLRKEKERRTDAILVKRFTIKTNFQTSVKRYNL